MQRLQRQKKGQNYQQKCWQSMLIIIIWYFSFLPLNEMRNFGNEHFTKASKRKENHSVSWKDTFSIVTMTILPHTPPKNRKQTTNILRVQGCRLYWQWLFVIHVYCVWQHSYSSIKWYNGCGMWMCVCVHRTKWKNKYINTERYALTTKRWIILETHT